MLDIDMIGNTTEAFLALVRAGLWEKEVCLSSCGNIDYERLNLLAQEQAVDGLIAAGLEHVVDVKVPKEVVLQFVGCAIQLEQRNVAMNDFIATIIARMRKADIYTLLIKGQGIAQCYERPLWRVSGDVDFFLSKQNYPKAKTLLLPLATVIDPEEKRILHQGMTIGSWIVELHGKLHGGILAKVDKGLDEIQQSLIYEGNVRLWKNGETQVFLPDVDSDVVYVFSHILQHYYKVEGVRLRQICDWCRLLWTYRLNIDKPLLEKRIKAMGIIKEWKTFAALVVKYLGMPEKAMPLYESSNLWANKAEILLTKLLKTGVINGNNDNCRIKRKLKTYFSVTKWCADTILLFPNNTVRVWWSVTINGILNFISCR